MFQHPTSPQPQIGRRLGFAIPQRIAQTEREVAQQLETIIKNEARVQVQLEANAQELARAMAEQLAPMLRNQREQIMDEMQRELDRLEDREAATRRGQQLSQMQSQG